MLPEKQSEKDQASCCCLSYTSTGVHLLQRSHWVGHKDPPFPKPAKCWHSGRTACSPGGQHVSPSTDWVRKRKATRILAGSSPIFSPSDERDFPILFLATLLSFTHLQ